jgi:predicted lysophospholipase L1 biosynthesis ABC-type transport system permease subunit
MKREQWLHLAALVAVVLLAIVIVGATGAIEIAAGVVIAAAVVLHLGVFGSLIAWVVRRVKREREYRSQEESVAD